MSSKTQALYEKGDWVGKQLSDLRFNAVLPLIRGRLLDLGCGDNRLVRAHGNGTGVDVEDFGADLTLTNFDSLPFEDSSFDTVAIIASINYFPRPAVVLCEGARVLRPDGRLLVTMANAGLLRVWHLVREPWAFKSGYTFKAMNKLLENAGFRLQGQKRFMFGMNSVFIYGKAASETMASQ